MSTELLRDLVDAVDALIASLKETGRLRPCFWLPALEEARAAVAAGRAEPDAAGRAASGPTQPAQWIEVLLLVNEYAGHVNDAVRHQSASRADMSQTAAALTLGKLRKLLGAGVQL